MNKTEFAKRMAVLAQLTPHFELDDTGNLLGIYNSHLKAYGYERVCLALDEIIASRNARDPFPSVKEIKEVMDPQVDEKSLAVDTAERLWAAVGKFGWCNDPGHTLGEIATEVIRRSGGWRSVCNEANQSEAGIFKAQKRELARAVIQQSKAGKLNELPALPKPSQDQWKIADTVRKSLPKGVA